jgi:DNA-binding response OmpR family regulator
MHILIIEDDALLAMKLQYLVEDLGASSSLIATSQSHAVAQAKRYPPDVIIADLHLGDGLGVEAVRLIRAADTGPPVVYVTGDPEEARRLDPGALVLSKPLREFELIAALARLKPLFGNGHSGAGISD